MIPASQPATLSRTYTIGIGALVLLITTVALGLFLGTQTRDKFREIEASWIFYSGDVDKKGVWISSIRGYLGYGGIIHNFKNYVLRGQENYLDRAEEQIDQFNSVMAQYLEETLQPDERASLIAIKQTIDLYSDRLRIVTQSLAQGLDVRQIDGLVAIDDRSALQALWDLEVIWQKSRSAGTNRIFTAVSEGQKLIWIGFASIAALVLAALVIGYLLIMLLRDLRDAIRQLSDELVVRRQLEQSEGRLERAVEQSPATIFITDTQARILYVNRRFTELTGWTGKEVEGKTPKFLQSGDTPPEVYDNIRNALEQGREWRGIFRNRKKNGESYWVKSSILPLIGPDGTIQNFIGIGEDITEKREAREQVARAQKLEAVGLLAGGIAHDFNNILTTIVGAAHLAELDAPKDSDIANEIDQINIAARRAQSLVKGLLTFARREPGKPKPNNLSDVVEEIIHLLQASIPPTIEIVRPNISDEFIVLADHTHLHQIIMNLSRNAAEAIGGNPGRIEFEFSKMNTPPNKRAERDGGWVKLTVTDNGPGMSSQTLKHLFDPFFTTKPLGKGSGLGLAVVSGLVEEMGGVISVESELGKGSAFTVIFPGAGQKFKAEEIPAIDLVRGSESVILIDDQPEVAATLRRVLMRFGYRVDAFTSPVTALDRIEIDPQRYDLMITDMVMPGLNGEELANRVRDVCANMPIIICTGYNPKRITVHGARPAVLNKPIEPAVIARKIREIMDS